MSTSAPPRALMKLANKGGTCTDRQERATSQLLLVILESHTKDTEADFRAGSKSSAQRLFGKRKAAAGFTNCNQECKQHTPRTCGADIAARFGVQEAPSPLGFPASAFLWTLDIHVYHKHQCQQAFSRAYTKFAYCMHVECARIHCDHKINRKPCNYWLSSAYNMQTYSLFDLP